MRYTNLNGESIEQQKAKFKTWQMTVNLDNIRCNYDYLLSSISFLLLDSDYAVIKQLQEYCSFYDKIEWEYVSVELVREYLEMFKEEHEQC